MDAFRGNNAYDRLSALRQSASLPVSRTSGRGIPRVVIIVSAAVLVIALVAFVLLMRFTPRGEISLPTEVVTEQIPAPQNSDTLLDGEAYISLAANIGSFPPSLSPGDTVQIVVAPGVNSDGLTRMLDEQAVVREVQTPTEFGNTYVITLRAPQSVATAIIDAEKVHLSIIEDIIADGAQQ